MKTEQLDEETKGLLRRIVESQAYRQRMIANVRGHGLKLVIDLGAKIYLAKDLAKSLESMQAVEDLHREISDIDLVQAVRPRMERIPYPETKLELAVCMSLTDRAEQVSASAHADSISDEFAQISRSLLDVDRSATRRGEGLFIEFCKEYGNRPRAQQMFDRWAAISIRSMGRPGSAGDARAVALGLRSKHCAESIAEFLQGITPLRKSCELAVPNWQALGVEIQ